MRMSLLGWRYGVTRLFTPEGCICADCQEEDGGCEDCAECIAARDFFENGRAEDRG